MLAVHLPDVRDDAPTARREPGSRALPADHLGGDLLEAVPKLHRQHAQLARRGLVPSDASDGVPVGAEATVGVDVPGVVDERAEDVVADGAQTVAEADDEAEGLAVVDRPSATLGHLTGEDADYGGGISNAIDAVEADVMGWADVEEAFRVGHVGHVDDG